MFFYLKYIKNKIILNNYILSQIPHDIKTYVEPFGNMFKTYELMNYIPKRVIYNDINFLKYNYFYYLSHRYKRFYKEIKKLKKDEYLWFEYKSDIHKILKYKKRFDLAIKFIYVLLNSKFNKFELWNKDFENFKRKMLDLNYQKKIKKLKVYNKDYKFIIENFDKSDSFFFIEPPTNKILEVFNNLPKKARFIILCNNLKELKHIFENSSLNFEFDKIYKKVIIKNF